MGTDGKTTTSVKDANGHVNKEVTNEAGLTESTTDLGDGEEQITTAYSYDTNGNKIRETYADGGYKTFDYDRKNRLIKTESYEAGEAGESIGEKTLKTVYSYDINDRLLESIDYQIDGAEETAIRYTEYQYDRRGQTTGYAELSQEPMRSKHIRSDIIMIVMESLQRLLIQRQRTEFMRCPMNMTRTDG